MKSIIRMPLLFILVSVLTVYPSFASGQNENLHNGLKESIIISGVSPGDDDLRNRFSEPDNNSNTPNEIEMSADTESRGSETFGAIQPNVSTAVEMLLIEENENRSIPAPAESKTENSCVSKIDADYPVDDNCDAENSRFDLALKNERKICPVQGQESLCKDFRSQTDQAKKLYEDCFAKLVKDAGSDDYKETLEKIEVTVKTSNGIIDLIRKIWDWISIVPPDTLIPGGPTPEILGSIQTN